MTYKATITAKQPYEYFGSHRVGEKIVFRVLAPAAVAAYLVGDFNSWDESCPMQRADESGAWEVFIDSEAFRFPGHYKFKFLTKDGNEIYKSDPYGMYFEDACERATRFFESRYEWRDSAWLDYRKKVNKKGTAPEAHRIYKINRVAWRCRADGSLCSYPELFYALVSDIKRSGCTHIGFAPLMEKSLDSAWGYRTAGFFAPTSRYGDPDEFRALIDLFHRAGIGVILDWAPVKFANDCAGLGMFDGTPLYECKSGACAGKNGCFDLGCTDTKELLISNALFWADSFHIDGLRLTDAELDPCCTAACIAQKEFLGEVKKALAEECPDVFFDFN